ncbi:hypothetical protein FHW00_003821 [Ochrobactrum sp. P6BSIII]|nr:hypothetical protein [Ochrobactrum sp. P6BSIII]
MLDILTRLTAVITLFLAIFAHWAGDIQSATYLMAMSAVMYSQVAAFK